MVKMYVANCTKQVQDFQYVLPGGNGRPRKQPIAIGGQIRVSGDLSTAEVAAVVEQHAKYGMRSVLELRNARDYTGLIWDEKPINVPRILPEAFELNDGVLDARGRQIRTEAAVAANNRTEEQSGRKIDAYEVSIVEEDNRRTGHTGRMNETTRVTREADPTKGPTRTTGNRPSRRRASKAA